MILSCNLLNDFNVFHLNQEIAKIIQPNQQCGFPISYLVVDWSSRIEAPSYLHL
jgi:hypothetical protein